MPRPTRNSAWVVVPEVRQTGRRRRAFHRGDVDMGGQVLAPDVDVRVVVDAVAQVGTERPVAAPDRVVELGGGVAVVDEEQHAALETGRRVREPRTDRQADLCALTLRELDRLVGEPGGQVGRRRLGLDVDERAVARPDEDLAQARRRGPRRGGPGARRGPRWRGRNRSPAPRCGRSRRARRRGRRPRGGWRSRRAGAARSRSGRSAGGPRGPGARRSGHRGSRPRACRSRRRTREGRTAPADRAGPRRPRPPGRGRPRRSGGPRGRSGSRRRDPGGRPRHGSSRRSGSYSARSMNRAKVIGPSRAISSWIRATRSSSCPTASRSGTGSRRMPGVTSTARAAAFRRPRAGRPVRRGCGHRAGPGSAPPRPRR